ncbi:hypothetical protein WMY93_012646 [Mugilogobius chulae]|uniref:Uncharacterized protein n=1 Tax=Mugilogobius chulae TaxID=88201 RepID=A0AAW0P6T7_9GOBI
MYARRLEDAGVEVTSVNLDCFHGCFSMLFWPFEFDQGKKAFRITSSAGLLMDLFEIRGGDWT